MNLERKRKNNAKPKLTLNCLCAHKKCQKLRWNNRNLNSKISEFLKKIFSKMINE